LKLEGHILTFILSYLLKFWLVMLGRSNPHKFDDDFHHDFICSSANLSQSTIQIESCYKRFPFVTNSSPVLKTSILSLPNGHRSQSSHIFSIYHHAYICVKKYAKYKRSGHILHTITSSSCITYNPIWPNYVYIINMLYAIHCCVHQVQTEKRKANCLDSIDFIDIFCKD